MTPIVADGDTGHGGLTAVMKLTQLMVEAGAAGVHFEDQSVFRVVIGLRLGVLATRRRRGDGVGTAPRRRLRRGAVGAVAALTSASTLTLGSRHRRARARDTTPSTP